MDAESLEGLKKEKKIGKMTYGFKIWAQKYKLDKLFYCCSDFLPLLLKQLVLFSARHKSMNKMIHDSFLFHVIIVIREKKSSSKHLFKSG